MFGLLPRWTPYVLVLALTVFAAVQYVPIYFTALQFHDAIRQEVRFAGTGGKSVAEVESAILDLAREYGAAIPEDGLAVSRNGPSFVIRVRYSAPVDLYVYQHEVGFDWQLTGETFEE